MSLFDIFNKKASDPAQTSSAQTSTTAGAISQGAGCGYSHSIAGGGVITSSMQPMPLSPPLTKEETEELKQLYKDHEKEIKMVKLDIFKKLDSNIRQLVINVISWKECVHNMNSAPHAYPKNHRLEELEERDRQSKLYSGLSGIGYIGNLSSYHISSTYSGYSLSGLESQSFGVISLPEGITIQDLRQAHLEATLEESMVDDGNSNT